MELAENPATIARNNLAKVAAYRVYTSGGRFTLTKNGYGIDSRYTRELLIDGGRATIRFVTAGGAVRHVTSIEMGTFDAQARFVPNGEPPHDPAAQLFLRCAFHDGECLF